MQQLISQFLRPNRPRFYNTDLGPIHFSEGDYRVKRSQHIVDQIPFSLYEIKKEYPTIMYIHTYNSNRLQVKSVLHKMLKRGFNVISIEFQRVIVVPEKKRHTINEEDGIITFGYYEFEQLRTVMHWIRKNLQNRNVILWGRSMGAVSAIRYQHKYNDASALVLDSPFHNLSDLMALKVRQFLSCPEFIAKRIISSHTGFDIQQYQLSDHMGFKSPVIFIFNPNDPISNPSTNILYSRYQGQKQIFYIENAHNEQRDSKTIQQVLQNLSKKIENNIPHLKKVRQKITQSFCLQQNPENQSSLQSFILHSHMTQQSDHVVSSFAPNHQRKSSLPVQLSNQKNISLSSRHHNSTILC